MIAAPALRRSGRIVPKPRKPAKPRPWSNTGIALSSMAMRSRPSPTGQATVSPFQVLSPAKCAATRPSGSSRNRDASSRQVRPTIVPVAGPTVAASTGDTRVKCCAPSVCQRKIALCDRGCSGRPAGRSFAGSPDPAESALPRPCRPTAAVGSARLDRGLSPRPRSPAGAAGTARPDRGLPPRPRSKSRPPRLRASPPGRLRRQRPVRLRAPAAVGLPSPRPPGPQPRQPGPARSRRDRVPPSSRRAPLLPRPPWKHPPPVRR